MPCLSRSLSLVISDEGVIESRCVDRVMIFMRGVCFQYQYCWDEICVGFETNCESCLGLDPGLDLGLGIVM